MERKTAEHWARIYTPTVWSRGELRRAGMTDRRIRQEIVEGRLQRIRRDHYAHPDIDPSVREAVRIGGRLSCLSLLSALGVFVHRCEALHVQLEPQSSRIRSPQRRSTVLHWSEASDADRFRHVVPISDAVRQSIRCQTPRAALATLDSVLNLGLMTRSEIAEAMDGLPARFQALLPLMDGSAGSGPETFTRLILRALGLRYETQVPIPGVGEVDFVVEGWLIIECDSKAYHSGWEQQRKDRYRDLAAARLGYVTIRPLAADVMDRPDWVRESIEVIVQKLGSCFTVPVRS